jgi:hypothetical protein
MEVVLLNASGFPSEMRFMHAVMSRVEEAYHNNVQLVPSRR